LKVTSGPDQSHAVITDYLSLGLAIGRHLEGFVDSYYGPPELAEQIRAARPAPPGQLREAARRLLAALDTDSDLKPSRRRWMSAQVRGMCTTARKLAGEPIAYLDEIEACYGVRPRFLPEDEIGTAHQRLAEALPGPSGNRLAERYIAWREGQAIPPDKVGVVVDSLAEDFRGRSGQLFGLPAGERVDFELVTSKPWSGFNHYLGGLRSRVSINVDLPVLASAVGGLVAHESYPGHHTEHCRKEAGLVRRRDQLEETIFLVGTPQCLVAEGLADLALEIVAGVRPESVVADHLHASGIDYDADVAAEVSGAQEVLSAVRGNAAILIHDRGRSLEDGIRYMQRWGLMSRPRAEKFIEFVTDPTWRAYPFCYIDGLRLCRGYVQGEPARFERLITEQVVPVDLIGDGTVP
jgi:hypothetical protein